jgi:hypothetical protein
VGAAKRARACPGSAVGPEPEKADRLMAWQRAIRDAAAKADRNRVTRVVAADGSAVGRPGRRRFAAKVAGRDSRPGPARRHPPPVAVPGRPVLSIGAPPSSASFVPGSSLSLPPPSPPGRLARWLAGWAAAAGR